MDEQDSNTAPDEQPAFEVTRRTVIETGATALLLTALPHAALAAGTVDDDASYPSPAQRSNCGSTAIFIH
jgi:xanthine dehydrogenase YagT iron-sulfur-binding subunit